MDKILHHIEAIEKTTVCGSSAGIIAGFSGANGFRSQHLPGRTRPANGHGDSKKSGKANRTKTNPTRLGLQPYRRHGSHLEEKRALSTENPSCLKGCTLTHTLSWHLTGVPLKGSGSSKYPPTNVFLRVRLESPSDPLKMVGHCPK